MEERKMTNFLSGIRVLEYTNMLAGPFGGMLLGDLGAEVVKVEVPMTGDKTRVFTTPTGEIKIGMGGMGGLTPIAEITPETSRMPTIPIEAQNYYYLSVNRNKKSLALDTRTEKGREMIYELVKKADVVYDNIRPDALKRLGLNYEKLKKINPRIISCSLTGFGHTGPSRDEPSFDNIIQSRSGLMGMTGSPEYGPAIAGLAVGDLVGATYSVLAIASALYYREITGKGQKLDIALLDSLFSYTSYASQDYFFNKTIYERRGTDHPFLTPFRSYKTKDGWVTITALTPKEFENLCKGVINRPDLLTDERFSTTAMRYIVYRKELNEMFEDIFLAKTSEEWMKLCREHDVCVANVNTIADAVADPQILARDMVVEIDKSPEEGKYKAVGNPFKSSEAKPSFVRPPVLGEHTEEILKGYLGYSDEKIQELLNEGIISIGIPISGEE